MKQSLFHKLLSKYITKDIDTLEEYTLERFDHEMLKRNGRTGFIDKKEVWSNINDSITNKNTDKVKGFYRYAAIILVLIGIGVCLDLLVSEKGTKPQTVEWVSYSAEYGKKLNIVLSDGSTLKLNSGSSVSFPKRFENQAERKVVLKGEAYFDVEPNPDQPFIVTTDQLDIKVLGTAFNINAYHDKVASVDVERGKVNVITNRGTKGVNLKANEGVRLVSDSLIKEEIDFQKKISWLNNSIEMSNATAEEILFEVKKWYGIEFQYDNDDLGEGLYKVSFQDLPLNVVLNEISNLFCVIVEGGDKSHPNTVILTKTNCD